MRVAVKERGREAEGIVKIETKILVFADGPNTLARRFGIGFEVRPDTVAESAIFEIGFGANHKKCLTLRYYVKTAEADVGSVHHVKGTWFWDNVVQDVYVVHFPVGDLDKCWYVAA